MIVSYSKLNQYRKCPFLCKNPVPQDNKVLTFGKAFHSGIESFLRNGCYDTAENIIIKEAQESSFSADETKEILDLFRSSVNDPKYMPEKDRIITIESDDGEIEDRGRKMFLVKLPVKVGEEEIFIRGAFDLVLTAKKSKGLEIRDWKTGFKDADEFQAELYALVAYLKYWKSEPIFVRFDYVRRGFHSKLLEYGLEDLGSILQYTALLCSSFHNEKEWKPKFGIGCRDCDYKNS